MHTSRPRRRADSRRHYDVHDVFVLQLAGEKRWIVHEPEFEAPLRSQPWTARRRRGRTGGGAATVLDVVLRAGDALYLPEGSSTPPRPSARISAHLTVGIHVVTRHAVVEELLALAREDIDVRRSLPLGLDLSDPSVAAEVASTISSSRILDEMDEDAVLERLRTTLAAMTPPPPVSPLAEAAAAEPS